MNIAREADLLERASALFDDDEQATESQSKPPTESTRLLDIATNLGAPAFWQALSEGETLNKLKDEFAASPSTYSLWRAQIKAISIDPNLKVGVSELDKAFVSGGGTGFDDDKSAANIVLDVIAPRCELWHNADGEAFASFENGGELGEPGHIEHWAIGSEGFREWVQWKVYEATETAVGSDSIKSALTALAGKAKFDGDEREAYRRVAPDNTGGIWIDVGDAEWSAIHVTRQGWNIVAEPPIAFTRNQSTRPLPTPEAGGDIAGLWGYINVHGDDRLLLLAWLLESLRPGTPYAVLELSGEQGSSKSTSQSILRGFIDPNRVPLRGKPKTPEDAYIAASNNHLLSFENLSGITADLSDVLCAISTGAGFAGRKLFTNGEESLLMAHCPIALNGINLVVTRPDLLDRTVSIQLPVIAERRTESDIQAELDADSGEIMGAILDLLVKTLAGIRAVNIAPRDLPRMADFAVLGESMSRSLGYREGHFLAAYAAHRRVAIGRTLDSSPVATAIVDYVASKGTFTGTVKNLLETLNFNRPEHESNEYWPKSPKGLADMLRRYAPALRQVDITVTIEPTRRMDGIHCSIRSMAGHTPFGAAKAKNNVHEVHEVHRAEF